MKLSDFGTNAVKAVRKNAPGEFTALSVAGVIGTAYLTGRASYKAALVINDEESRTGTSNDWKERLKGRGKLVWKLYIPPVASGVATVGCIFGLSRVTSRRATAAAAAYAVAERGFEEYKEKVTEELGKGKEQKIRDSIAQDKVDKNPPNNEIFIVNTGLVLCCELYTHRYFRSDMETLRRAEDTIKQRIETDMYVMLSEFYDQIGLPHTSHSDYVGWEEANRMELRFTTTLAENGEPCLAFDYSYIKPLA